MEFLKNDALSDKTKAKIDCIKKAAEAVHYVAIAKKKCKVAYNALSLTDKKLMWDVLQQYLREYKEFINMLTGFTGYYIYTVDKDFYNQCSLDEIRAQLENVIGFVYAKEVLYSAVKDSFKQCLKKMLKETRLFTDAELSVL